MALFSFRSWSSELVKRWPKGRRELNRTIGDFDGTEWWFFEASCSHTLKGALAVWYTIDWNCDIRKAETVQVLLTSLQRNLFAFLRSSLFCGFLQPLNSERERWQMMRLQRRHYLGVIFCLNLVSFVSIFIVYIFLSAVKILFVSSSYRIWPTWLN